ncbi:beta strand repeat-containing protein [Streptomyces tsukubensis]
MHGSPRRGRRFGALFSAGLVLGAQLIALGVARAAAAPGAPGLPQGPPVVYAEGFENGTGQTPILLSAYTGAPPVNAKYTAAPAWISAANCNGIILDQSGANNAACQNQSATAMAELKSMANVLGQVAGSATPGNNHAVSAYTDGANPGANKVEIQTVNPIPLVTSNRFITFSVDVAAVNCNVSAPLLNFFLTGSGPDIPANDQAINPCTDPRSSTYNVGARPIQAGSFASDSSVFFTGSAVGIKMTNANGSGLGNDHAYDNLRILDVTPQLDKGFSPASIPQGGVSTLTFTVTNTSELAEKNGFSFSDNLPSGVTVAAVPNAATTCGSASLTAVPGTGVVGLSGGVLAAGTQSCTFTVDVTSNTAGTYVNQPANVTPSGVNPPGPATLIVTVPGSPTIMKSANAETFATGDAIMYSFVVTNTASAPLNAIAVTDNGPGTPAVSCPFTTLAAGTSMTCTATYTAMASDAATGTITDTATVTGTVNGNTVNGTSNEVVIPLRALTVTKSADPNQFTAAGQTITYAFQVTNTGRVPLTNLNVVDNGPGSPAVTCPGSPLDPGQTVNCIATYTTTAADVTAGSITDTAQATGTAPDGELARDTSNTVTIPFVAPEADLALTKTGPAAVNPGGEIDYELTVTNNGPDDSSGWTVSDPIPAGLANAATTTPGCSITGGTLTCTGGALPVGDSTTIALTGTAAPGATGVTNTATVTGDDDDPNPGNNTDTTTTTVTPASVDLALTKTGPASVTAGGQVSYTITVTNNGPNASTGWTVSDPIPAGLTNAATTTAGCSISAGTLTCTGGALAVGGSTTIALTGTADVNTTSIVNTATVDGDDPDPNPGNNTDTTNTTVNLSVDLALNKTGPASVTAGGAVTYTITVTNNGPSDSTGWTVVDAIPAGLTNAATTTAGCSISAGTLTCTGGGLAVGDSRTITFTGTASPNATRILNTATVDGDDPDPNPGNNTDTTNTRVNPSADLALNKTGPSAVTVGGTVSYAIVVTNNGPSDSTGWTVTDPIPAGLTNAATTTAGCSISAGTLTCTGGPLAVGDSATITLTGTAPNAGTVTNTATVDGNDPDPNPGNNSDTTNTTVTPLPVPEVDLAVTKTGPAAVLPGDPVTYTITVSNNGPDASTGWTVTDPIPAGLTNAATTTAGCSISAGTLTCTGGALAVGGSTTITLTGTAAANAGSIVNTAIVDGDDPDPDPNNNQDSTTTTVGRSADLAVSKSGPASVSAGGTVSYTITVSNNGPSDSTGWTLSDPIPAGLTNAATTTTGCSISAGTLTCTGGPLAVGDSRTITFTGTAAPNATSIANTATVDGNDPDPNPGNNRDTTTTTVTPVAVSADLAVTKTGPASVDAGGQISYTITITNNGPDDSTGWTLTDTLPTRIQNPSTTSDGCGIGAGRLTCTGGPLAVGDSVTVTVSGTVAADATGSIANTATVDGNDPDPKPGNNTDTTNTPVNGRPELTITKKQDGPSTVRAGDTVDYTITVTNTGTVAYTAADPASFTDDLSGLLDDAAYNGDAAATRGTVTYNAPVLSWSGALAPGQTATITFSVTTHSRTFGDLKLINTVVSDTPGNNCPPDGDDPRCTTSGKVKPKDKGKDKGKGKKVIGREPEGARAA